MNEIKNKEILTRKDLEETLNIGKDKAYALMKSKSFPSIRIGKTYMVMHDDLMLWLKQNVGKTVNI